MHRVSTLSKESVPAEKQGTIKSVWTAHTGMLAIIWWDFFLWRKKTFSEFLNLAQFKYITKKNKSIHNIHSKYAAFNRQQITGTQAVHQSHLTWKWLVLSGFRNYRAQTSYQTMGYSYLLFFCLSPIYKQSCFDNYASDFSLQVDLLSLTKHWVFIVC